MDYQCHNSNGIIDSKLSGRLTFADMKIFRAMIDEIKNSEAKKWIVDLTLVDSIDSAGLGLLLRLKATSEEKGADLSLRVPTKGKVKEIMDISEFEQLIPFTSQ